MNMDILENITTELWDMVNNIPNNTTQTICIGDIKISITKNGDSFDLSLVTTKEEFDDSEIKEKINSYKEFIEELDDNLFIDILEEMKTEIDVKEFDTLIEKESFTEEEADRVETLIDHSKLITKKVIQNKVKEYMKYYDTLCV